MKANSKCSIAAPSILILALACAEPRRASDAKSAETNTPAYVAWEKLQQEAQALSDRAQMRVQGSRILSYEPRSVRLEGQLNIEPRYGPPNFGENPSTDQTVEVPILVLRQSITVVGDTGSALNHETVKNIVEIQLLTSPVFDFARYARKPVVVTGQLSAGVSGNHYTKVVMTVTDIDFR